MRSAVIRSVCVAGIGFGSLTVLVDAAVPAPLLADPIAALSIAFGGGVLVASLPGTRWLRMSTALIAVGALILGVGYLIDKTLLPAARNAAFVFLGLAVACAVRGWPELVRLLDQTKARSVLRFQNYHAARIADELHDEVLQALALTSRRLDSAVRRGDRECLVAASRAAVETLSDQATILRGIVSTLHPVTLRHVGLAEGTRELTRQVAAANGLVISVVADDATVNGLDPEIATVVYRVVQEALRNIVKHAEASTVRVRMACYRSHLAVTVSDDGRGWSGSAARAKHCYGLASMRWWCAAYGGDLTADNSPGGGARIRATFQTRIAEIRQGEPARS
ncbi:ATP-binding protein [Amycolatopsis mongoliensis]|uniref:histidine kinase n=1 Tax=Amycolatopsis mongoliensis TaxID=715475 RepID=A0A9Y2NN57_9PSEU|nr:ATP-binding protein [Amycolatopsis sp. 4-36]WIY05553.1 ATP-binding protein [Amycolatopsis sp. 4-36]